MADKPLRSQPQSELRTDPKKGTRYYIHNEKVFTPHIEAVIRNSALSKGLNPEFLRTVIIAESSGWSKATSRVGAKGIAQWMPNSWKTWSKIHYGKALPPEDREDPVKAIPVSARYLAWLQKYLSEPEFRAERHRGIQAVPVNSWSRKDWSKIFGMYNSGPYSFVGARKWETKPDYMNNLEKLLTRSQNALRPQTRVLLFGDSITEGYHKTNDIKKNMSQRGWDVLILPKRGADSKFWLRTFKNPLNEEQTEFNRQISEFDPTYIIAGSLGGNDAKYLARSKSAEDPGLWNFYKKQNVKPLMDMVAQWGGSPPAGKKVQKFGHSYDDIKKQINDEYKEMADKSNTPYHDMRQTTMDIGMEPAPEAWHFSSDQYRRLWAERSSSIEELIRGPIGSGWTPAPPSQVKIKQPPPRPGGSQMPTEEDFDTLLQKIRRGRSLIEKKAALERMYFLLSENA